MRNSKLTVKLNDLNTRFFILSENRIGSRPIYNNCLWLQPPHRFGKPLFKIDSIYNLLYTTVSADCDGAVLFNPINAKRIGTLIGKSHIRNNLNTLVLQPCTNKLCPYMFAIFASQAAYFDIG